MIKTNIKGPRQKEEEERNGPLENVVTIIILGKATIKVRDVSYLYRNRLGK